MEIFFNGCRKQNLYFFVIITEIIWNITQAMRKATVGYKCPYLCWCPTVKIDIKVSYENSEPRGSFFRKFLN